MLVHLGVAFILLLTIGVSAAGVSAQNDTTTNATDPVNNSTKPDNATGTANNSKPTFVNGTETSDLEATNIVINEVELNPRGSDAGKEWIELYNPAGVEANISGFEIRTSFKSATIRLPSGAVIDANETYVIQLDRRVLSNTAESLVLANASGDMVDRTPSLVDSSDDSRTWQRMPDGNNEWQFAASTRDELNDPDAQASAARSARSGSTVQCQGKAGCAEGVATRIVDGDTLYVKVDSSVYKVDLALASAPSRAEQGFVESRLFIQSLCLGSSVLVDQDDKLLTSETSIIAVVYCASTNLNSELLDSGYARLNLDQCKTSEFASQSWATDHGC